MRQIEMWDDVCLTIKVSGKRKDVERILNEFGIMFKMSRQSRIIDNEAWDGTAHVFVTVDGIRTYK